MGTPPHPVWFQVFLSNTNSYIVLQHLEPRSNGNEEVLHIPQNSMSGASPSDSIITRILVVEAHLSAEMQSTYYVAPADWASSHCGDVKVDKKKFAGSVRSGVVGWLVRAKVQISGKVPKINGGQKIRE